MSKGITRNTNIKLEADSNFSSYTNMDNWRDRYSIRTITVNENNILTIKDTIVLDLNISFLETHKYMILADSDTKLMQPRWVRRPDYLSYDVYGTTSLDFLLMFINNIFSIIEFDAEYVIIPTTNCLNELISINLARYPERDSVRNVQFL